MRASMAWMLAALGASTMACDNVDSPVIWRGLIPPEFDPTGGCTWEAEPDTFLPFVSLDPASEPNLALASSVQNTMNAPDVQLGQIGSLARNQSVVPESFNYVFECDPSVFAGTTRVFLPSLGPGPFCQRPREDGVPGDETAADGPAFGAGDSGVVNTRIFQPKLVRDFRELFTLATAIEDCCRAQDGNPCRDDGVFSEQDLIAIDPSVDPDACNWFRHAAGIPHPNQEDEPELPPQILLEQVLVIREFAQFSQFNFDFWRNDQSAATSINEAYIGNGYRLGVRGSFAFRKTDGGLITSTPVYFTVDIDAGRFTGSRPAGRECFYF